MWRMKTHAELLASGFTEEYPRGTYSGFGSIVFEMRHGPAVFPTNWDGFRTFRAPGKGYETAGRNWSWYPNMFTKIEQYDSVG